LPFEMPWTLFSPSTIRMVPFPTREYTDDEFQSIVKSVMGLLYLLGFLYPISRLISYSVFEKEQKIREGLYMMGLKDEIFHLSWFITYALVLKIVASLLSPTAFALGSINFADYERAHVGLRWSNTWLASSGVSFFVCLLMMLLDSILYCAIGLYLDKVLPRENGVRYPWNFIFSKCFGRKKNQYHIPGDETFPENIDVSQGEPFDPVIESISLEMRQQELDGRCIQVRNLHK
ncbi:hypothetical protein AALP_AAs48764U000100, partial [Arabis alpina]